MNFQKQSSDGEHETSLNLTSLIDVMFLLVIFFAVSTTFKVSPGLSIKLPEAHSEKIVRDSKEITAVLTEKGEIYLDGEKISQDSLFDILREKKVMSSTSTFILEADEKAMHGKVVELMDAARQVGLSRLAIATRPKGNQKSKASLKK